MPRRKKKSTKKVISDDVEEPEKKEEVIESVRPQPVEQIEKKSVQLTESDFPSKGELIIGKCTKITPHGAYFLIEGYEKLGDSAGFVHISELSKTWIRNIRKHIKEGQKTVSKVLRVNPQRAEVDLSIRRTTDAQKRATLKIFKQEARAKSILGMSKDQLNLDDEAMDAITETLYTHFGQLVTALEKTRDNDYKILLDIGIEEKIAKVIADLATKELENESVQLGGKLRCSLHVKNGLEIFKTAINDSIKQAKEDDALNVYVQNISAPDYRITIEADDWKKAEKSWKSFQNSMEKKISKHSPTIIEFSRL